MKYINMRDLREKRVKITTNGQVVEYASIRAAAEALDVNCVTMGRWARGEHKPSIGITVEFA